MNGTLGSKQETSEFFSTSFLPKEGVRRDGLRYGTVAKVQVLEPLSFWVLVGKGGQDREGLTTGEDSELWGPHGGLGTRFPTDHHLYHLRPLPNQPRSKGGPHPVMSTTISDEPSRHPSLPVRLLPVWDGLGESGSATGSGTHCKVTT